MQNARVYSYLRFSDPKQAAGSSIARQVEYAQRWAGDRGLPLDESLSLRDEGLSAYHQHHVKQGALGVFLRAAEDGHIAPGSILIVEGLDRLSRAEPIQAQAQLAQIINAGITVVTASDGKEYNRERLKSQPMDLVYSLLVMIRAHEESDTKSKRVKAAIRRQCEGWLAGTWRGVIRVGKDPIWLRLDGSTWSFVPERATAVRRLIELYRLGEGSIRIAERLNAEGLILFPSKSTPPSSLYRILHNPALIGTRELTLDGEVWALPNYYPALLSEVEYAELQSLLGQRLRRKGKGDIPGVLTGMRILRCGYCGQAIVGQNSMGRRKADGTLNDGHRRLLCVGYSGVGEPCPVKGGVSVVPVENALMRYCADQFNLSALLSGPDTDTPQRLQLASIRNVAAETERQLQRITDALMADTDQTPLVFVRKARELETALSNQRAEIQRLEYHLASTTPSTMPAAAEAWAALVEGVASLNYDARLQARQLVADTFERIVVYHRGMTPREDDGRHIDLVLIPKGRQPRMLRINRKTGAWNAGEDVAPM
ncbi:recombinase family protein [Chitiniphilus purpureus]|uniref:Recombinase family protein n=1 Tax=Chitiniphilus purpureus TaxID=2981137 RepID=A0ABY6DL70_9NEIS|nr:recombinase family protein [Chitiniphilus sp. CD1]UXY13881.1 recombinase family protein [Chitiniphilus sp. CD1]